jgi:3'-phosphoadenosine 5'-phosphosulfate sulfotransferase
MGRHTSKVLTLGGERNAARVEAIINPKMMKIAWRFMDYLHAF